MVIWKICGGDIPTDRPVDGLDQTAFLTEKQKDSARDSRLVFFNSNFVAIRWRQFKFHTMLYEKERSLVRPAYQGISLPHLYNLQSDPKERLNIIGESGASNVGAYMLKMGVKAQASFADFPNGDYSGMSRDR